MNYRLTAFRIAQEADSGMLLCHTLTGSLVWLTEQEYEAVRSSQPLAEPLGQQLAELGFLADPSQDEYALVDARRARMPVDADGPITSYTILPTTRCNARCFYCYESGIPQINMSRRTAEDVAAFIARRCQEKKVHLGWFGGEPTLGHPIISLICQRLRELSVAFESSMISNGLLLDPELIHTAAELWKLRQIQITIDGTEAVYNATKNYKGQPGNPFAAVLANTERLLDAGIRVSVRINLGLHNFEDVSELTGELARRFSRKKGLHVYVHEIDNYYSDEDYLTLMDRTMELNDSLARLGLQDQSELPSLRLHSCMADSDSTLLINPLGDLGKCEHYVYEKLHGSIYSQETDLPLLEQWKKPVRFPQCGSCPFYGACLRLKWCNGGGYFCKDGMIRGKLDQTRRTMLRIYRKRLQEHERFVTEDRFRLAVPYQLEDSDGQLSAVFFGEEARETVTVPLNKTAREILECLQQPCTIPQIVAMFRKKYETSGFSIPEIVEEYILSILQLGICVHTPAQPESSRPLQDFYLRDETP